MLVDRVERMKKKEDDEVDSLDSLDSVDSEGKDVRGRKRVHGGSSSKDYEHLGNFDMNELCARVVVIGRKPGGGDVVSKCPY